MRGSAANSSVIIKTFGYQKGQHGGGSSDLTIDCRSFRNPHKVLHLRNLDGHNIKVRDYVLEDGRVEKCIALCTRSAFFGRTVFKDFVLSLGCYGGQHRSVVIAEEVAKRLEKAGVEVGVYHQEIN